MTEFFLVLAIFILAHSLPEPTGLRERAITRFGKGTYILLYSIFSTIILVWLISAALRAPYFSLWHPGFITSLAPIILMMPACILFTTALLHPNPLSISIVSKPLLPGKCITGLIRHPLLWALFFWAASHTIANGDLVGVIMFGGFALFSLVGMKIMQRRAKKNLSANEYVAETSRTSGPFASRIKDTFNWVLGVEMIAGISLYVIVLYMHEPVIGVDPTVLLLP